MSRAGILLLAFFIGTPGLLLYSCENCDDCGPLQKEPAVTLKFINLDSLITIQENIALLNSEIDTINMTLELITGEIQFYNDSIQSLELLVSDSELDLEGLRNSLQEKTDSLQTTFTDFQNLRIEEQEKVNALKLTEADIESGRIRIDSLTSTITETSFSFGVDSLETFRFPLSINDDSTRYAIFITGIKYELLLEYERAFNEDEKSRIEVVVSNIKIGSHTFKEAVNSCEVCGSNDTSITLSF